MFKNWMTIMLITFWPPSRPLPFPVQCQYEAAHTLLSPPFGSAAPTRIIFIRMQSTAFLAGTPDNFATGCSPRAVIMLAEQAMDTPTIGKTGVATEYLSHSWSAELVITAFQPATYSASGSSPLLTIASLDLKLTHEMPFSIAYSTADTATGFSAQLCASSRLPMFSATLRIDRTWTAFKPRPRSSLLPHSKPKAPKNSSIPKSVGNTWAVMPESHMVLMLKRHQRRCRFWSRAGLQWHLVAGPSNPKKLLQSN